MRKISLLLFVLAAMGELFSNILMETHNYPETHNYASLLHYICKPFIMMSLVLYYMASSVSADRSKSLIMAMLFSLAGDVLLMNNHFFIAGLISFLLAHIMYIFAYHQHQYDAEAHNYLPLLGVQRVRLAFPIILAGTGLVVVLYPVLGNLKIPVMVYAAVLSVMVITALFRYGRTNQISFWMVFAGAVLFMISDSLLAFNKFLQPISLGGFWVMLTYVTAQFLIVDGLIRHK